MLHPIPPSNNVIVQIAPCKDVETVMHIKAMAGTSASSQNYHVFEMDYVMPKFAMYHFILSSQVEQKSESYVTFSLPENPRRVWSWMQRSFIALEHVEGVADGKTLNANFVSLRNSQTLTISMTGQQMTINVESMEVAGEIIQDLVMALGIAELESTAHFPVEMERFKQILHMVDEYNDVRLRLTAEMADNSNLVKALVVKGEDYRVLADMKNLKKVYAQLQQINGDLMAEYTKRATNHAELLVQLKEVNMMIQKAAKLRVGQAKTRVVSACRQAIKSNNIHELFQIIRTGMKKQG